MYKECIVTITDIDMKELIYEHLKKKGLIQDKPIISSLVCQLSENKVIAVKYRWTESRITND